MARTDEWTDETWTEWCRKNGYPVVKFFEGGLYGVLVPKIYTVSVAVGEVGDESTLLDQWCYKTFADALQGLDGWDGEGEPSGWFRHHRTGRRVAQEDGEFDQDGVQHAKGDLYVSY